MWQSALSWLTFLYFLSYIKLAITLAKYAPQVRIMLAHLPRIILFRWTQESRNIKLAITPAKYVPQVGMLPALYHTVQVASKGHATSSLPSPLPKMLPRSEHCLPICPVSYQSGGIKGHPTRQLAITLAKHALAGEVLADPCAAL